MAPGGVSAMPPPIAAPSSSSVVVPPPPGSSPPRKRGGASKFDTQAVLSKAETLANAWKFDKAVKCIEEILARHPGDPELTALRIYYIYLKSRNGGGNKSVGLVHRTLRDVQGVLRDQSIGVAGNLILGNLYNFLSQKPQAIEYFQQVLVHDPKNAEAFRELQNLGVIARNQNKDPIV